MNTQRNEKREQRVDDAMASRLADLRTLWERFSSGKEDDDDLGRLADYGRYLGVLGRRGAPLVLIADADWSRHRQIIQE